MGILVGTLVGILVGLKAFKIVEFCKIMAFTTTTDNLIVVSSSIKVYTLGEFNYILNRLR